MKPSLFLIAAGLAFPSLAFAQVRLESHFPQAEETSAPAPATTARVNFPGGYFDYLGKLGDTADGKLAETRFGLSFHRPDRTNGGWDLWRFLRVWVRSESGIPPYEITERHLLKSAEILEDDGRRVFEFRWALEEEGGQLVVTAVQYPSQEEWMMIRVSLEGNGLSLDRVGLSAFPGNTAGPQERERWIAVGDQKIRMTPQFRELPRQDGAGESDGPEGGIVLYNQMAQQDAGCLVVAVHEGVRRLSASGGYNISLLYEIDPGTTEFRAALGGFNAQQPEEVIRVFMMEGARNMMQALHKTSWTPKPDFIAHQRLFSELEALVADIASAEEEAPLQALKERYQSAKEGGNIAELRECVAEARAANERLVRQALDRWK